LSTNVTESTSFSDDLPGTSYEEGGYKRVREVQGILAEAIRSRLGITNAEPIIITEYHMYGAMFEPETEDECDLIITCGEFSKGFSGTSTKTNMANLAQWAVLPV